MHKHIRSLILSTLLLFYCSYLFSQSLPSNQESLPPFLNTSKHWVDSVFKTLSAEEKISQLMMIRSFSNRTQGYEDSVSAFIAKHKVGGIVFFQGGPVRQARLTNRFQSESKVPLLIAIDGEWGFGMRLDSTMSFPYQMALGAIQNDSLIYEMGAAVASDCKRLGIHVNFAPVVDVNNNPNNPVINYRSFGEDKYKVATKSYMYMKGMQDNGIITTAKHFPGHGDTDVDSHEALPLVNHDKTRLDSVELYPFRYLISRGLSGVMVAHLSIPKLDSTKNLPSTLSRPIVTDILKRELGFQGLIFTDALDMKGVTSHFNPGEIDLKAVVAGNDVLELSENIPAAIEAIKNGVKKGVIKQADIDGKCKKVLAAKYWAGLSNFKPVEVDSIVNDLNSDSSQMLNRKLIAAALTLVKNDNNIIPIRNLSTLKMASVSINTAQVTPFQMMLGNYTDVKHFQLPPNPSIEIVENIKRELKDYDLIIVGVHQIGWRPRKLQLDSATLSFFNEINKGGKAIVSVFTNPYSLNSWSALPNAKAIIMAYYDKPNTEELAAQLIFGAIGCNGKLSVTANSDFKSNHGIAVNSINQLKYSLPIEAGMSSTTLKNIDSLVAVAIHEKALPGCQILAIKDGAVIYKKSFGSHTYSIDRKVLDTDIYDLASVTKVIGSLPALMKLYDDGKFNPDAKLGDYLPEFKKSNKGDLTFREMLTHQARLKSWIPFWENALKKKYRTGKLKESNDRKFKWFTFKTDSSKRFPIRVADNLYLHRRYYKRIFKEIKKSPLNEKAGYVYSDLSFYLYPIIVEKITGRKFEEYLKEEFYKPMGANSLTFHPDLHYSKDQIVPTEYDSIFRRTQIHGNVHDEGAAMLNGVSGHAGLFGNVTDVAKMMEMYANKGRYGDKQFIKESTIEEFTRCQFCDQGNRRALGFDKPVSPPSDNGNAAKSASIKSFGHAGFTGIFTWVDPEYNMVYVFLSNRVYPTRTNNKISKLNTRTNIQEVLYKAIMSGKL